MILLLGGTSETAPLALALRDQGHQVLVSTATDAPLDLPEGVRRRWGRLDAAGLAELAWAEGISVLVDAGHPFAVDLHREIRSAATLTGLPLLRYARPTHLPSAPHVHEVLTHEAAAHLAFSFQRPVLLTCGGRNLHPYALEGARTGLPWFARVLDHPASLQACREAGLPESHILAQRGPFDVETNRAHLRRFNAGALVSKASGDLGGVPAKVEACGLEGIPLILLRSPETTEGCTDVTSLLAALPLTRSQESGHAPL